MTAPEPASERGLKLTESVTRWLRQLNVHDLAGLDPSLPVTQESADLLQRAARCYSRAGLTLDAGRAFERLGDHARAAACLEHVGHWEEAARAYSRAGEWESAGRCWLRIDRPEDAAECLHKAGQTIEAAWLLADRAGRYRQASELVGDELPTPTDAIRIAVELIRARCDAGERSAHPQGARRLRNVIAQLSGMTDSGRDQLFERAFVVAAALGRPDLVAQLHAAAVLAKLPRAADHWDQWAADGLGTPVGFEVSLNESEPARELPGE